MNVCEECGREFKTPQALGAHRVLYHRVTKAELEALKSEAIQKADRVRALEAELEGTKAEALRKADRMAILEAERQASACPQCEKLVGWHTLPIKTRRENPWYPLPFRLDGKPIIVKGKECPVCGYFEQSGEE